MTKSFITISTEYITLDAFLKWASIVQTGGEAKTLIASGAIAVNGEPEVRRGRKLRPGDSVLLPDGSVFELKEGEGG